MSQLITLPLPKVEFSDMEERRQAIRYLGNRLCYVKPNGTNSGVAWGVHFKDISQQSISLILRCCLQPGTIVAIQPARGSIRQALFAQVIRHDEHEQGWLHVCKFLRPIDEPELQRWITG